MTPIYTLGNPNRRRHHINLGLGLAGGVGDSGQIRTGCVGRVGGSVCDVHQIAGRGGLVVVDRRSARCQRERAGQLGHRGLVDTEGGVSQDHAVEMGGRQAGVGDGETVRDRLTRPGELETVTGAACASVVARVHALR